MATINIHTCWHRDLSTTGQCPHCGAVFMEVPPWHLQPGDDVWGENPWAGTFQVFRLLPET